jgi:GAF domain-containing protein
VPEWLIIVSVLAWAAVMVVAWSLLAMAARADRRAGDAALRRRGAVPPSRRFAASGVASAAVQRLTSEVVAHFGAASVSVHLTGEPAGGTLPARAMTTGRPAIRADAGRVTAAVPLIHEGVPLGALVVEIDEPGRPFGARELALLERLAAEGAAALDSESPPAATTAG